MCFISNSYIIATSDPDPPPPPSPPPVVVAPPPPPSRDVNAFSVLSQRRSSRIVNSPVVVADYMSALNDELNSLKGI
jgi:hypothetical protein